MYNTLFYIILVIVVVSFLFERLLDYLNTTRWSDKLPDELKGIYDPDRYEKSQKYEKDNLKFGILTSSLSFFVLLAMLFLAGFAVVDHWARGVSENTILIALVFFGILGLGMDILNTPFSLYDTFVIEEKYGFNKTTLKTFFLDKIKGWFLSLIIGGGLLALVIWFYMLTGKMFWIYTWLLMSGFMIFMTMFYSTLIVPLFNKQTPLEDGELKTAIKNFADKVNFKLDDIFVIDGSKRSTKANAYFSGLGAKKRIVLFDTLVEDLKTDEIVAVLAHEIGHYKKKHTKKGMILSVLQTGLTLFILSLLIDNPELSEALGAEITGFHLGLIAFGILYSPVSTVLGLGMNIFSRKNEYQADDFAGKYYKAEALTNALKKLSVKNLSNLRPHPVDVFINYSHPPLMKRLENLRKE